MLSNEELERIRQRTGTRLAIGTPGAKDFAILLAEVDRLRSGLRLAEEFHAFVNGSLVEQRSVQRFYAQKAFTDWLEANRER
jgi:hypothetical protein